MAFSNTRLTQITKNQIPFFATVLAITIQARNKSETKIVIELFYKGNRAIFSWLNCDYDTLHTTERKLQKLKSEMERDLSDMVGAFNSED